MKIKLQDLNPLEPKHVEVAGHEDWLAKIYDAYPLPAGASQESLKAQFDLTRLEGDFVQVVGNVAFSPYVNCSRCNQPLLWPIDERVQVYYQPAPEETLTGERDLAARELDEYFLEDEAVDLEALINETIVLAIPSRTFRAGPTGCGVCEQEDDGDCVYASHDPVLKDDNPFKVLKGLKLDD